MNNKKQVTDVGLYGNL